MEEERYEDLCVKEVFRTDKHLVIEILESWGGTIIAPSVRIQKLTGTHLSVQHPQQNNNNNPFVSSNGVFQTISDISCRAGGSISIGGNVIRDGNNTIIGGGLVSIGGTNTTKTHVYIHECVNETIKIKGDLVVAGLVQTRHLNVERLVYLVISCIIMFLVWILVRMQNSRCCKCWRRVVSMLRME
jgi:hypothetical protein